MYSSWKPIVEAKSVAWATLAAGGRWKSRRSMPRLPFSQLDSARQVDWLGAVRKNAGSLQGLGSEGLGKWRTRQE